MLGEPGERGLMGSGGSRQREDGKMSFKGPLGMAFSTDTQAGPEGQPCQPRVRLVPCCVITGNVLYVSEPLFPHL